MVRILGLKLPIHTHNKRNTKRRLTESARTPQGIRERHPLYEYARNEFAQTVQAGSSNDDGQKQQQQAQQQLNQEQQQAAPTNNEVQQPPASSVEVPAAAAAGKTTISGDPLSAAFVPHPPPQQQGSNDSHNNWTSASEGTTVSTKGTPPPSERDSPVVAPPPSSSDSNNDAVVVATPNQSSSSSSSSSSQRHPHLHHNRTSFSSVGLANLSSLHAEPALSRENTLYAQLSGSREDYMKNGGGAPLSAAASIASTSPRYHYQKSPFEQGMVSGILYQEAYGDAYTGAPMRYVYPTGYQSMRPRSGPWRLSILICICFTWLSVFVVGHCSDQAFDYELYYYNRNANGNIDDDSLIIDIRWCGSRPLYLMWVASMLITGLSAAYCGVIGYIKCRDFAVANSRSQPTVTTTHTEASSSFKRHKRQDSGSTNATNNNAGPNGGQTSDYYFDLEEQQADTRSTGQRLSYTAPASEAGTASDATTAAGAVPQQRRSIYQSDGNPQFWGSQIYRPTQAAVAVTSR